MRLRPRTSDNDTRIAFNLSIDMRAAMLSCSGDSGRPCSNVAMRCDTSAPSNSKRLEITVPCTLAVAANCFAASEIPTKMFDNAQ